MPFSDCRGEPAGVVLLQGEDNVSAVVRPTLDAMGAQLDRIMVIAENGSISIPQDIGLLRSAVEETKAKLVVVDPMDKFMDGNLRNKQQMHKTLLPLVSLAEEQDFALLCVRHPTKGTSNALDFGAGSKGIIGLARSALLVGQDPGSTNWTFAISA